MNKKYVVRLTSEERATLARLVSVGRAAARKILHGRVLLMVDQGQDGPAWPDGQVSQALGVHPNTIGGIRQRFVEQGVEAALNRQKRSTPGRQQVLDGRAEARLLALRCGEPPEGRRRWTLRLLADRLVELEVVDSVSYETVRQTLKKTS
jgi:transposase